MTLRPTRSLGGCLSALRNSLASPSCRPALALIAITALCLSVAASASGAPASGPVTVGSGQWRFEVESGWVKLPSGIPLGPTHGGVVIDKSGLIYTSSNGPGAILVFRPDGTFLKCIARSFAGIHSMMLRTEQGHEFIYAAHLPGHQIVKLSLDGAVQWTLPYPRESGLYKSVDDYKPTAVAVGPDGRIYVADGYGSSVIHEYSSDRKWIRVIGTKGKADGQFSQNHGIALDTRYGAPLLLVCDRQNRRLVHIDMDGHFVRTLTTGLRLPSAVAITGDYAAVAELEGRVVITDRNGAVVATIGDNPDKTQWANFKLPLAQWREGIFIAPHSLAFDASGNLFVQDWNFIGRLTKLRRLPSSP